ncbi:MAG: hypothetical protein ABW178_12690 [Pseudoxanthomonas sp.]
MMRSTALAVLYVCAGAATAQQVHVCNGPQGKIYQTMQCPPEQDTGQSRKLVKDPNLTWQERQRHAQDLENAHRRMQAEAGRGGGRVQPAATTVIGAARNPEACEQAKSRREYTQALGGEARAKALEPEVRDACKP